MKHLPLAALILLAACQTAPAPEPVAETQAVERPISWSDLLDRPRESATAGIPYGSGEEEFGELWLPEGAGPFPVVVMIHGGCWLSQIPGTILQDYLAADLRARGIAVWNLEYSRIGHETGAWPGTFVDVLQGTGHLETLARDYPLDLDHVVYLGHSAGGHLALWAAARLGGNQHADAVITLAGINDLADYRANGPGRCGEPETVDTLVGDAAPIAVDPAVMLPLGVPQIVIAGALDPIVPPDFATRYAAQAEAAGDPVEALVLPGAGHFELIDPTAPAWTEIRRRVETALEMDQSDGM